jgi:hypothetical protein
MIATIENPETAKELLATIVVHLENRGYDSIKADHPDYESPSKFIQKGSDDPVIPDVTAQRNGSKYYFEIAQKTDNQDSLVSKWKLLSTMAHIKKSQFKVFVPHGSMQFTRRILKANNIDAGVVSI